MLDQIIVLAYLAIVLIIGFLSGRNTVSLEDYAIGKRNFSIPVLAAGIAATMIDAGDTSGLTGKIYTVGLIGVLSYFGVVVSRLLIAFLIAPRMKRFLGLISSGDIFENLYGKEAKILIGILTLIEGPLLAGAQILATYQAAQIFFGVSKETAAIVSTVITMAYCFRGGIRSVTATDFFQLIIMMIAIPIMATFSVEKIGGIDAFINLLEEKHLLTESLVSSDKLMHITIFVSMAITCVFPLTIQRMLMAKDAAQIKKAFFINGLLSIFFYTSIGIIGLSAPLLLPGIDPNFALPSIVNEILPIGVRGLVIAGLIAIFMSSVDSDINITSIAMTQDLLKPIFNSKISGKLALIIARCSFILTGIVAIVVALYYSNALDILFLIMVISNSVYFPGMFFGILGIVPSKQAFWVGVFSGAVTASVMCIGYDAFPLYAMLAAIFVNSSIILLTCAVSWLRKNKFQNMFSLGWWSLSRQNGSFLEFKKFNYLVSTSSYCDIFATLVLINSIVPFFLTLAYSYHQPISLIMLNITVGALALLLLLRQNLHSNLQRMIPIIWHMTVLLSLTCRSAINLAQNKFGPLILFDFVMIFCLLLLLVNKREILVHAITFIFMALGVEKIDSSISMGSHDFLYWSVFLHSLALILCLVLFRKRDVEAYRFMSLKFVHEAGRTISSVSTSASLLKDSLPRLVDSYRKHHGTSCPILPNDDLDHLLEIPNKIINTSTRTWENLRSMASWMEFNEDKSTFSIQSIQLSLQSAINDNSLSEEIREKINIAQTTDFLFYGDNMQITNVILNLIENAHHAIKDKPGSEIKIWTSKSTLFIRDEGVGISKSHLPSIFDEFFSTKGTSGQGLAFCKLIMQQHNGTITCESELGEYTQFKLNFPEIATDIKQEAL